VSAPFFTNGRIKVVMPDSVEIKEVFKVAADRGVQIRRMKSSARIPWKTFFLTRWNKRERLMAVYKRRYASYLGSVTPERSRFLVLTRLCVYRTLRVALLRYPPDS